jgi:hypothetical protein
MAFYNREGVVPPAGTPALTSSGPLIVLLLAENRNMAVRDFRVLRTLNATTQLHSRRDLESSNGEDFSFKTLENG